MSPLELSQEAQDVIRKVRKLLAIAEDERGNEHQAAAAAAKAQELLDAYNLSMASLNDTREGTRSRETFKGGLYNWQRNLWNAVARLNFCMYFFVTGERKGSKYQHQVLGRVENVIGAQVMAEYLQQTIERLARTEARERGVNIFCRPMIAYREGMASRLVERLESERNCRLAEERRKEREAQERATASGQATSTAVTLSSYMKDEDALNIDFRWGYEPGTTARRRAEALAEANRRLEQQHQWELENPEEAARQKAEREAEWEREMEKERRRRARSRGHKATPEEERRMMAEFDEGYEKGDEISLNQQVDDGDIVIGHIGG